MPHTGVRVSADLVSGLGLQLDTTGTNQETAAQHVQVPVYQHLLPSALPVSPVDVAVYQRYMAMGDRGHAAAVDTLPLLCAGGPGKAAYYSGTVHLGAACVSAGDLAGNAGLMAACFRSCDSTPVPLALEQALGGLL